MEKIVNYRFNENIFSCETKCYQQQQQQQQPYLTEQKRQFSHNDNNYLLNDIDLLELPNEYAKWLKLQLSNLMDDREIQIITLTHKINQQFMENLNQFLNTEINSYKLNNNLAEIIKLTILKDYNFPVSQLQNMNLKMEIVSLSQNDAVAVDVAPNVAGYDKSEEEIINTSAINRNYFNIINPMENGATAPPQSRIIYNKNSIKMQPISKSPSSLNSKYFIKKTCYSQPLNSPPFYPQSNEFIQNQYHDVDVDQQQNIQQQQQYLLQLNEQLRVDPIKNEYIPSYGNYENSNIRYYKIIQKRPFQQQQTPVAVPPPPQQDESIQLSQQFQQNTQNNNVVNNAVDENSLIKNYLNLKGQLSIGDFVKLNGNAKLSSSVMQDRKTNFKNILRGSINTNVSVPILNSITKNVMIKKEIPLIPFNIFKQQKYLL